MPATLARAFEVEAIDMVCLDFKNLEILEAESRHGRELGFSGKVRSYVLHGQYRE